MKKWSALFVFFLLVQGTIFGDYLRPPHVTKEEWSEVKPFFLPETHPAKTQLDTIFSKERVVLSKKSMKKAGFIDPEPQRVTRVIVTRHPAMKGIIIKAYLDAQRARKNRPESYFWLKRIHGARLVQSFLDEKGWNAKFKVPKKWIYPLPAKPAPPKSFQRINFILVEEDMELVESIANRTWWKSNEVTAETLASLYTIIEAVGLSDCCKPDNIPLSIDGRIAFVDTETHNSWPIPYKKLCNFLNSAQQNTWLQLSANSRPVKLPPKSLSQ